MEKILQFVFSLGHTPCNATAHSLGSTGLDDYTKAGKTLKKNGCDEDSFTMITTVATIISICLGLD